MQIRAVISNKQHQEYGVMTIPFPILENQYTEILNMLGQLSLGDGFMPDCHVDELRGDVAILKRLEGTEVNIDELDYLAKRLDSFTDNELAQFQGMAYKDGYTRVPALISLTFCCQCATVVTDFSNPEALGKQHYLNLNEGGVPTDEMEKQDFRRIALDLLQNNTECSVTPYGVVYPNGMELNQVYFIGEPFPEYAYKNDLVTVALEADGAEPAFLYLPMPDVRIERELERFGVEDMDEACIIISANNKAARKALEYIGDTRSVDLHELNGMCRAISAVDTSMADKLCAALEYAQPTRVKDVIILTDNLDLFEFVPDISTPEQYGRQCIQESGHHEYDENLESYYDFERYGQERISREEGEFNKYGYISYHGELSIDELLQQPNEMTMEGM